MRGAHVSMLAAIMVSYLPAFQAQAGEAGGDTAAMNEVELALTLDRWTVTATLRNKGDFKVVARGFEDENPFKGLRIAVVDPQFRLVRLTQEGETAVGGTLICLSEVPPGSETSVSFDLRRFFAVRGKGPFGVRAAMRWLRVERPEQPKQTGGAARHLVLSNTVIRGYRPGKGTEKEEKDKKAKFTRGAASACEDFIRSYFYEWLVLFGQNTQLLAEFADTKDEMDKRARKVFAEAGLKEIRAMSDVIDRTAYATELRKRMKELEKALH